MRVPIVVLAVSGLALSMQAAEKHDLPLFAAKVAAAVKAAIPGSEAQVQGTIALVKKGTVPQKPGATAGRSGAKQPEMPSANGVMFLITVERYWTKQPFAAGSVAAQLPKLPKTPAFDHQHAKLLGGYYHTNGVQVFEKSNVVLLVDVMFGQKIDTATLQRAYAELTRVATSEL
jgi:hypothetical protein